MAKYRTAGSTLSVRNAGASTWVLIGEITSWDYSGATNGRIEVTPMTRAGNLPKEYLTGRPDAGSISVGCNFDPDDLGRIELDSMKDDGTARNFKINMPVSAGLTKSEGTFTARVEGLDISGSESDGAWRGTISLLPTTKVTFAAPAA